MKIQLLNGTKFELITNGVQRYGDQIKYLFKLDVNKDFYATENEFSNSDNVEKVYILDNAEEPIETLVGYSQYKGIEKKIDYVISSTQINTGTEEEPVYEMTEEKGDIYIVTMSKLDLEEKYKELQDTVDLLVIESLGV